MPLDEELLLGKLQDFSEMLEELHGINFPIILTLNFELIQHPRCIVNF